MPTDAPETYTIAEAAAVLNCDRATIYRRAFFRKRIVKNGSRSLILASDLRLYLTLHQTGVTEREDAA